MAIQSHKQTSHQYSTLIPRVLAWDEVEEEEEEGEEEEEEEEAIRGICSEAHEASPVLSRFNSVLSTKTECDYLNGWIKKVTYAKNSPKMANPRDIYSWGTQKKKKTLF